jgi:hypothetical protein
LRIIVSKVSVYSISEKKWINISVSNTLVNILKDDNGNVSYLSHSYLPTGTYTKIKVYFKYVASILSNNAVVDVSLYNNSSTFYNSFTISQGKTTYIAPVFNVNKMIGDVSGNYTFIAHSLKLNIDY